jgi:hypothetical protein
MAGLYAPGYVVSVRALLLGERIDLKGLEATHRLATNPLVISAGEGQFAALFRYLTQHKMVGRVEVGEKPDVLWELPGLTRLFTRLEDEYELSERKVAVDRKLDLISRTVETLVDLLQNKRALRVEWYIVILIVIEIFLTPYQLFAAR